MPSGIVIHCSDSPHGRGTDAKEIHKWHLENGWDGIGYHYVILEDGVVENGRPDYWQGAHAPGYNGHLGICLIGEGAEEFTDLQIDSLEALIMEKQYVFDIDSNDIIGHNAVSSKSCPNFDWKTWLEEIGIR